MDHPSKCVILVPANGGIEPATDHALRGLERSGYPVWRVPGFSQIDICRSQLATDALAKGFEELMWIDADMQFDPAAVDRLRSNKLPICCGLYPKKGQRSIASSLLSSTTEIVFGPSGGLLEIRYAATGFLHTRRKVYADVQRACELPTCNAQFGHAMVPFFTTLIIETENSTPEKPEHWCLSEDFSFCHRARQAGHKIYADTTIRLGHIGRYTYSWEDAGTTLPRYEHFRFSVSDAMPKERHGGTS